MQWHHSANSRAQSQSQGGQENTQWAMALLAPMARGPKSLLTAPLTLTAHAHSVSHLTAGSTPYIRDTQCPQCAFSLVVGFMSFAHLEVAPSFCSDPSGPFLGFRIDTRSSVQSTHTHAMLETHRRLEIHITTLYRNGASCPCRHGIVLYHWSILF